MDRVDPRKRIGLFVDEWGSWYRVEPGHPDYGLYQQNSLRDAVLAGLTLHIFQDHNDRIRLAAIAQLANVLQAMILTDGQKMLLTPTYHVFDMFQVHQDAARLPIELAKVPAYEHGGVAMPALSLSASRDAHDAVHLSLVNAHATEPIDLVCKLPGVKARKVSGRILTADKLDAHNTFDRPDAVKPKDFSRASLSDGKLAVKLPPHSVVVLTLD
jgi:alpha-N-arabinofuranosidase